MPCHAIVYCTTGPPFSLTPPPALNFQTHTHTNQPTNQDIAYFDKEENSTGAITARLATEVTLVKNVTGQNLGRSVQNVVTVAAVCIYK